MKCRKENFKLGNFHGKIQPKNPKSEAQIRNDIFLIGHLGLKLSKTETIVIRIVSHEMPLENDNPRGRCIDLFGIDKDWNAYIIELKRDNSNEELEKVVKQVSDYAEIFEKIKNDVALEMQTKLFYKNFEFSPDTKKIIISNRDYYDGQNNNPGKYKNYENLFVCSFYNRAIEDEEKINLLEKNTSGILNLSIKNK